jgi:hypothetical protein
MQVCAEGYTSQQPGVEMSNNQPFGGGGGGDHCLPMSGIFNHKLN